MKKLSSINVYNIPHIGGEIKINFEKGKAFLVLTGFNGSGKSRVITSILETLALVRDHDYVSSASDWVLNIAFEGGGEARALKMNRGNVPAGKITSRIGELMVERFSLKDTFKKASNLISSETEQTLKSGSLNDDSGNNRNFCGATLYDLSEPEDLFLESTSVVAYIDDQIHFNYERKLEKIVYEKEPNLNKTLFILISELISSDFVKATVVEKVEDTVKKLMKEFLKGSKKNKNAVPTEEAALSYIHERIDKQFIINNSAELFSQNELFRDINLFFKSTNRKMIWNNNRICLELADGTIIDWYNFSKGEKTLLSLFLMVYLYRDTSVFLMDEPESSLHVEWQRMLFPALMKMAPNSQFIIATHSPFLVMNTDSEQVINMAKFSMGAKKHG
ncbi:AAA family ATPase [Pseudomonas sp. CDFA 610]|uniref:AAA family ATPase n=1 Tax=Pseudomonas sp. CDFA 610 TaxID=2829825 RepID=UPI001E50D511|nr:ATP-binding protein [Pseudomonas sp. CDFA 610]MCD5982766.1 ATP-binding protein [Pseudomonas sp. CDFA 610]